MIRTRTRASALAGICAVLFAVATPASAAPGCRIVYIVSQHNKKIVSAEFNQTGVGDGILRARATAVGPWERFEHCQANGVHTLKSLHNGKYVSAEFNWSGTNYGILRARADNVGPWERFQLNGNVLKSTFNNKVVSAEFGWSGVANGILRARGLDANAWEKFSLERAG